MSAESRSLAIVTGASTGIGYELAKQCAQKGFDLIIAADEPEIGSSASRLRESGVDVVPVEADLATEEGVGKLVSAAEGRPVSALIANAGRGLGGGFLDQDFREVRRVIDTNVTGTLNLIQWIGRDMRRRGTGRILITGSIAGYMPGTFQAAYNGTKAFIDSFAFALRNELKDTGVTVTCLMPGPTETEFFRRAGMLDTKVGQENKADSAEVAQIGFKAMMDGEADVVAGFKNKLQVVMSKVAPAEIVAEQHRKMAAPGSGRG